MHLISLETAVPPKDTAVKMELSGTVVFWGRSQDMCTGRHGGWGPCHTGVVLLIPTAVSLFFLPHSTYKNNTKYRISYHKGET